MKTFHYLKYKVYVTEILNTAKGVIRNRELSLAASAKIKTSKEKQMRVTYNKRVTIRRGVEEIETHTFILTFNTAIIPNEIEIGHYLKK